MGLYTGARVNAYVYVALVSILNISLVGEGNKGEWWRR
jgi:hypothetical protein